jgi:hypothetical protein
VGIEVAPGTYLEILPAADPSCQTARNADFSGKQHPIFAERMLTSVEAFNLVYHPLNCEVHDDYEHNGSAK